MRLATPEPEPSSADGLSVTVPRTGEPGSPRETFGAVASTVQDALSGVASVLPAPSVARTSNVCGPSARPLKVAGLVQELKPAPSSEHSKVLPDSSAVKPKVASELAVRPEGPEVMVVSGGSRSGPLFVAVQSNWMLMADPW